MPLWANTTRMEATSGPSSLVAQATTSLTLQPSTLRTTSTTGIDILTFYTFNGGASPVWYGFASGLAMA